MAVLFSKLESIPLIPSRRGPTWWSSIVMEAIDPSANLHNWYACEWWAALHDDDTAWHSRDNT